MNFVIPKTQLEVPIVLLGILSDWRAISREIHVLPLSQTALLYECWKVVAAMQAKALH